MSNVKITCPKFGDYFSCESICGTEVLLRCKAEANRRKKAGNTGRAVPLRSGLKGTVPLIFSK